MFNRLSYKNKSLQRSTRMMETLSEIELTVEKMRTQHENIWGNWGAIAVRRRIIDPKQNGSYLYREWCSDTLAKLLNIRQYTSAARCPVGEQFLRATEDFLRPDMNTFARLIKDRITSIRIRPTNDNIRTTFVKICLVQG